MTSSEMISMLLGILVPIFGLVGAMWTHFNKRFDHMESRTDSQFHKVDTDIRELRTEIRDVKTEVTEVKTRVTVVESYLNRLNWRLDVPTPDGLKEHK